MTMRRFLVTACSLFVLAGCGEQNPRRAGTPGTQPVRVPVDERSFLESVDAGRLEEVRATLDAHPNWIDSRAHQWGVPPLCIAAYKGHKDVVALLLARGADVEAHNPRWGWRPIHEAASEGHLEIAKMLIEKGADLDVRNHEGLTPLMMAAQGGRQELVRLLLEHGSDANGADRNGWTLLHMAAARGDPGLASLLIARGLSAGAVCNDGRTPLHWAATAQIAKLLADHGAKIDAAGAKGRTPLHLAAFFGNREVAEWLMAAGADVNAADKLGWTALSLARDEGHAELANLLASKGAKGDAPAIPVRSRIGPRGQLYVDGRPVIPLGVWQQPERLFAYNRSLGMNCLVWPPGGGSTGESSTPAYVRAAEQNGLGAIMHYSGTIEGMPGVWGWIGGGWPVDQARRGYEHFRSLPSRRVSCCNFGGHGVITGESDDVHKGIARYVDCVVSHVWPEMFEDRPRDIRNVAKLVDRLRELSKDRPGGEVSIWPDINPHEWRRMGQRELTAAPSPEELTFQVWLALIHGADGICFFPISFEPFVFSQIPARVEEEVLPRCAELVSRFTPVLVAEESPLAIHVAGEGNDGIVDFTTRRHGEADYVFLVNGTDKPQTVTLAVEGLGATLQLRDAITDTPVAAAGGRHQEKLQGLELRIWKLSAAP